MANGKNEWSLPVATEIDGVIYHMNTDYRDILEIIEYLNNEPDQQVAAQIALALFYEEYDDMPAAHMQAAVDYLFAFIACFEPDDGKPKPKLIDWKQDYNMMAADINKVAGCEVRGLPYLHWFTFVGFFTSVGEGQLSTVVSIRSQLAKGKKLDKWQLDFYRENKKKVVISKKYTPEEQAEIDRLNDFIGRR